MPSIWKRGTLAAFMAAVLAGMNAPAQQPQTQCTTTMPCTQSPVPVYPGQSFGPLNQHPYCPPVTPPPWQPPVTDPSQVPPPPDPSQRPMDPMQQPMDPMRPMDPTQPMDPTRPMDPMDPMQPPMDPAQTPQADPMADLSFGSAETGIGSPDVAFNSAPNMMGDLLRAYRGITFSYLQAGDFSVANTSGAVNFRNSKVADNNSAIPRDRVSFRYNYFKEALQVDGLDFSPALGPRISQTSQTNPALPNFTPVRQFNQVQPASKSYNVHLYTFALEKAFLDNLASVEVRVPFARTIDSDLNLVSGQLISDIPNVVPLVQPTPGGTLGDADTELQDMNVILKAVLLRDPYRQWLVAGGMGLSIPTGEDLNARVVDFSNDIPGDPGDLTPGNPKPIITRGVGQQFAFDQRTRTFEIENSIWGVSPFLAGVFLPTERTFVNGFFQVEVPVNSADWSFREQDIDLEVQANPSLAPTALQFDRTLNGTIDDQILMHIDVGGGCWLYRNPCTKKGISGLAALLELHYTTTLDDADIVVVPETPIRTVAAGTTTIGPLAPPRLGNVANRIDILNLTMGSHVLLGDHIAISTAYVAPLRDDFDRTFDGELNVQLNLYR